MLLGSSLKYECPKTDTLLSPEYRYTLTGLSQELRSPSRVLGTGEGGTREENQFSPWLAVYLAHFYLSVHSPALTFPVTTCAREEQRGAKAREPLSFSKGDGMSELNDKMKEALGEQGGGVSFLYPHPTQARKTPEYYIQQRLELLSRTRAAYR